MIVPDFLPWGLMVLSYSWFWTGLFGWYIHKATH
jgi:hypothetical protein